MKAASFEELSEALRTCHCYRRDFIRRVYDRIQQSDYASSDLYDETLASTAIGLCQVVLSLTESMERVEKQMGEITEHHRLGRWSEAFPAARR